MNVSVRELKDHLSECLRRAKSGEEIVVTAHNKPLARLMPLEDEAKTEDEAIKALRALPWVRGGKGGKPKLPEPLVAIAPDEKTLAEMVIEQRG
jgi:prevent-host-death family protein